MSTAEAVRALDEPDTALVRDLLNDLVRAGLAAAEGRTKRSAVSTNVTGARIRKATSPGEGSTKRPSGLDGWLATATMSGTPMIGPVVDAAALRQRAQRMRERDLLQLESAYTVIHKTSGDEATRNALGGDDRPCTASPGGV